MKKTKRAERTDQHRPAEIAPRHYKYLFTFSMGFRPLNKALMLAVRTGKGHKEPVMDFTMAGDLICVGHRLVSSPWGKLDFFRDREAGQCDVCGSHYLNGSAYYHRPTKKVVLIGNICADKMRLHRDKGDWLAHQRECRRLVRKGKRLSQRAARAAQATERKASAARKAAVILEENPALAKALELNHDISRDLRQSLDKYGKLSAAQVALALRLQEQFHAATDKVLPPEGRVQIVGTVRSTKWQQGYMGEGTLKMLVVVTSDLGSYNLWGTVPSSIDDDGLEGSTVSFTAKVAPKEAGFGFFSRPTKAQITATA